MQVQSLKVIEEDRKVIKLVPIRASTRIVSLKARLLKKIGLDPKNDELYGRWKIVQVDGKKVLVLEVYPLPR